MTKMLKGKVIDGLAVVVDEKKVHLAKRRITLKDFVREVEDGN